MRYRGDELSGGREGNRLPRGNAAVAFVPRARHAGGEDARADGVFTMNEMEKALAAFARPEAPAYVEEALLREFRRAHSPRRRLGRAV